MSLKTGNFPVTPRIVWERSGRDYKVMYRKHMFQTAIARALPACTARWSNVTGGCGFLSEKGR